MDHASLVARLLLLGFALTAAGCHRAPVTVRVLAAASLVDLVQAAAPTFVAERGMRVACQFGASSEARAQLERGAHADALVLASAADFDALERQGLLTPGTRRDLFRNRLVLIVPRANPASIHTLGEVARARRLGIGEPNTVPAGRYARQVLERSGQWARVQHRLIHGKDVRVVMAWAERGEVDAAIVYRTDALACGTRVQTIDIYPDRLHDPIVYPGAVPRDAAAPRDGAAFLDFLASPAGRAIAARYGFEAFEGSPPRDPAAQAPRAHP